MENDKIKYRDFCKKENGIPIFSQDYWLDAVCGEDKWDVAILEKNNEIIASMPYYRVKKFIYSGIQLPLFTPKMGPYVRYPENLKSYDRLSFEKEVFSALIDKLPRTDFFVQGFHPSVTNWLPFYWKGYKQTTKYTYIIDDLTNTDKVFEEFNYAKKKNIKKAESMLEVKFDLTAEAFYQNHVLTLKKQNQKILYPFRVFENIYNAAYSRERGKTIYAVDKAGNLHGALFVVWDDNSAYNLISTIDPDLRNSGSASLLIKEIIRYVATRTKMFDFEGSMIENVENSFRQFAAKQVPYFKIMKYNSWVLKIVKAFIK
jgi:hypothetical protein